MPPEIQGTLYDFIKFDRTTTLAELQEKNASPVTIWKFNQIDTNHDGKLNRKEFKAYKKEIENRQNVIKSIKKDDAVEFYDIKLENLQKKICEFENKFLEYNEDNHFEKLLNYEHEKGITYTGLSEGQSYPEGSAPEDVEWRQMGMTDKEGKYFTGEICKKGYIKFPENLSDEDKKHYYELLTKAKEQSIKILQLMQEYEDAFAEYEKIAAVRDLVENNIISPVNSEKDFDKAYDLYRSITDVSNPFYKLYREAEDKYNTLARKVDLTTEEKALLTKYYLEMTQYKEVSNNWSVANIKTVECENPDSYINLAGERVTFTKDDNKKSVSTVTGASLNTKFGNFFGNGNIKITNTSVLSPEFSIQNSLHGNGSITYQNNGIRGDAGIEYMHDSEMDKFDINAGVNIKNLNIKVAQNVTKTKQSQENTQEQAINDEKSEDETNNSDESLNNSVKTTDISLSYPIGNINNTGSVHIGNEGTVYGYALNVENLEIIKSKQLALNLNPSAEYHFNNETLMHDFNIGLNTQLSSDRSEGENNKNALSWMAKAGYTLSSMVRHGFKPIQTNNLALGAEIKKGLTSLAFNAVNTDNDSNNSWTIGGSAAIGSENQSGKISIEASHTISRSKCCEGEQQISKSLQITLGYNITFDAIARKLGFKRGGKREISTREADKSYCTKMNKFNTMKKAGTLPRTESDENDYNKYVVSKAREFLNADSVTDLSVLNDDDYINVVNAINNSDEYQLFASAKSKNSVSTDFENTNTELENFKKWQKKLLQLQELYKGEDISKEELAEKAYRLCNN